VVGGGYDNPADALQSMGARAFREFRPDPQAHARYDLLYAMYRELHRHFGEGGTALLKRLKELRTETARV
jgi:L-ribulokinase